MLNEFELESVIMTLTKSVIMTLIIETLFTEASAIKLFIAVSYH